MDTQPQKQLQVLLLGDVCRDTTIYVESSRKNPECDAPLFNKIKTTTTGGMAYNVATCLDALGVPVKLIASNEFSVFCPEKIRYIDANTGNQICRVDEVSRLPALTPIKLPYDINDYSCIVISDYDKGSITELIVQYIKQVYTAGTIFVDTKKKDLSVFSGCILKINEQESMLANSVPEGTIITMGDKGARTQGSLPLPAPQVSVVDVCGAGDAFLAGLVYAYLAGKCNPLVYGICNASLSVQKPGTYAPTLSELKSAVEDYLV